jgi:hypothetical protein
MAKLKDVVFDCRHPASLARFWATVMDGYDVAPYDDEALAYLRSIGIDDPEDDPSVLVEAPGVVPRLFFNRVPEPKTVKNRVHLDVRAADRDAEVARLIAAGASEVGRHENWVVMADPEGNEFCVFPDAG